MVQINHPIGSNSPPSFVYLLNQDEETRADQAGLELGQSIVEESDSGYLPEGGYGGIGYLCCRDLCRIERNNHRDRFVKGVLLDKYNHQKATLGDTHVESIKSQNQTPLSHHQGHSIDQCP